MWKGKRKAVTFSYDDGVDMDRQVVGLLNSYGLKATFNLNSGIQSRAYARQIKNKTVCRMNMCDLPELYKGHEIASHGLTHANLTKCDDETIYNEILSDKYNLERLFAQTVYGMAYPGGGYDERVMKIAADCGIRYARTVSDTGEFGIGGSLLALRPSAHQFRPDIFEMIDRFLALETAEPQLLYIWGHSYELEETGGLEHLEVICRRLSRQEDVFYGTNREVLLDEV